MLKPPKRKSRRKPSKRNPWHRHRLPEGMMYGWKKAKSVPYGTNVVIPVFVKLRIPADARAILPLADMKPDLFNVHEKCRASKAVVLGIYDMNFNRLPDNTCAYSVYDNSFQYYVGDTLVPKKGRFSNKLFACAPGIHFFRKRSQAMQFNLW